LTQGFPRLLTVSPDTVVVDGGEDETLPAGVQARVMLNEDNALLPDLEGIERLITDALQQAA
jgi:chemosensory pili system protein ChpC